MEHPPHASSTRCDRNRSDRAHAGDRGAASSMRWLTSRSLAENGSISRWRFRSTLVAVGLIGVVFCAGLSVVGMKEQSGQLWRAMNDRSKENIPKHDAARSKSASNLKQIGNATANYATGFGALPATTIFNEDGRALHGWHYFLLPYIEQNSLFRQIDPKKPWNHSENAEYFRHGVECYFHVGVPVPNAKDSDGFGITTYATNVHAWSGPHPPKLADFENGASNILLVGEVAGNFKPWGYPLNVRDPNLGLNRSPDGFGGPWRNGTQFLMADGSVRTITNDVDPEVLKALTYPREQAK